MKKPINLLPTSFLTLKNNPTKETNFWGFFPVERDVQFYGRVIIQFSGQVVIEQRVQPYVSFSLISTSGYEYPSYFENVSEKSPLEVQNAA
jgi:hypothetical protein